MFVHFLQQSSAGSFTIHNSNSNKPSLWLPSVHQFQSCSNGFVGRRRKRLTHKAKSAQEDLEETKAELEAEEAKVQAEKELEEAKDSTNSAVDSTKDALEDAKERVAEIVDDLKDDATLIVACEMWISNHVFCCCKGEENTKIGLVTDTSTEITEQL
jgi:hypothetical protein